MKRHWLVVLALCGAGPALAQDATFSVSIGARAWQAEWTTFSYFTEPDPVTGEPVNVALTQAAARDELVLMPLLSVRYGDFFASLSAMPSKQFTFIDGGEIASREEIDLNIGYNFMPGLAATLGYKKVSQGGSSGTYRPEGLVVGLTANAPLGGAWSFYGSLGVGWLETPAGDPIAFEADYRLTELGLAYSLPTAGVVKRWTFTGGYRIQVLSSKDAFNGQDAKDTTQGFTIGLIASF